MKKPTFEELRDIREKAGVDVQRLAAELQGGPHTGTNILPVPQVYDTGSTLNVIVTPRPSNCSARSKAGVRVVVPEPEVDCRLRRGVASNTADELAAAGLT